MKISDLFEAIKKETAEEAFTRYNSLKKSNAAPELLAKVLKIANDLMDERFDSTRRNFESKFGGEGWWEEVKKMYKVEERGNNWVVTSNARDWKQTKDWEFPTKYEAVEQLDKLVKYKAADRKAGYGNTDKDFERVEKLRMQGKA